jgi:Gnt-I system high-affinity gluconate transporter
MSIIIVLLCIALLVVLIAYFKLNPFLAFLFISILAGLLLGIPVGAIGGSVQKGIGDMLGGLIIVIVAGAMLGKLVAESGAAEKISSGLMNVFGDRYIHWALMITGFIIGIPLFYNVGFVLVIPLIFSVVYRYKLPVVYVGLPMMAALSVTHGFLPPHPSPTALVAQFHADMGTTLLYGIIVAIPTVIIAGPLFAKSLKNIDSKLPTTFEPKSQSSGKQPGLLNSVLSSLLPVVLLSITTIFKPDAEDKGILADVLTLVGDPVIALLISLSVATFSLGVSMGMSMKKIMDVYTDAVKDIAMILLIMGGAGALKQVLIDSGVSQDIVSLLGGANVHPLVLGWLIAAVIRVCVGSATVAGITAAGIIAPLLLQTNVDANLMVLSIGAGSLMFSHVNDTGFWLFKEYFNLSIKDTIRSWSVMESIVAIAGLVGVMILNAILH